MKAPITTVPISVTMAKIGDTIIADPTSEEEACMDARVTMTTDAEGHVCAVQKGGTGTFTAEQVNYVVATAISKGEEIRTKIKSVTGFG